MTGEDTGTEEKTESNVGKFGTASNKCHQTGHHDRTDQSFKHSPSTVTCTVLSSLKTNPDLLWNSMLRLRWYSPSSSWSNFWINKEALGSLKRRWLRYIMSVIVASLVNVTNVVLVPLGLVWDHVPWISAPSSGKRVSTDRRSDFPSVPWWTNEGMWMKLELTSVVVEMMREASEGEAKTESYYSITVR